MFAEEVVLLQPVVQPGVAASVLWLGGGNGGEAVGGEKVWWGGLLGDFFVINLLVLVEF